MQLREVGFKNSKRSGRAKLKEVMDMFPSQKDGNSGNMLSGPQEMGCERFSPY